MEGTLGAQTALINLKILKQWFSQAKTEAPASLVLSNMTMGFFGGRTGGIRYDGPSKRPHSMPQTELRSEKIPRRRWTIALLLGAGILVNYFDRVNLSVSRDALEASFGISAVMFGYLSSAYNWTYAMLQLPSGLLLDRFGVRRVGIVSTVIWSVASFAAANSTGVGSLSGARFLLGIGEAPTFPANSKATGYWFPKNERSRSEEHTSELQSPYDL